MKAKVASLDLNTRDMIFLSIPTEVEEWSGLGSSEMDGKAGSRVSGSERVNLLLFERGTVIPQQRETPLDVTDR